MQSWDNYQRVKRRADEALKVVRANDLTSLRMTVFVSPSGGLGVLPECEALNEALGKAATDMWPELKARACQILESDRAEALAATRTDLQAALAEIDALESGGS